MARLYNESGVEVGYVDMSKTIWGKDDPSNFCVGTVSGRVIDGKAHKYKYRLGVVRTRGVKGGDIFCGSGNDVIPMLGVVTAAGDVYYDANRIQSDIFTSTTRRVKDAKRAEAIRVGRVEVRDGVGTAYNLAGVKVGEVREAGDDALALGGVFFAMDLKPEHIVGESRRAAGKPRVSVSLLVRLLRLVRRLL
jgi:hypothetical protein